MRARRPNQEQQLAISRRLALLTAELATVRPHADVGREAVADGSMDEAMMEDPAADDLAADAPAVDELAADEPAADDVAVDEPALRKLVRLDQVAGGPEVDRVGVDHSVPDPELAAALRQWDLAEVVPVRDRSADPAPAPGLSASVPSGPPRWSPDSHSPPAGVENWAVPLPGRHAARRSGPLAVSMRSGAWRPQWALGPGQLTVVAVVVAVGLGITAWRVIGARSQSVVSIAEPVVSSMPTQAALTGVEPTKPESETPASTAPQSRELVVDVSGKVRRPGIAVLPAGARVIDALKAVGGARPGVDLGPLNLARRVVDGEQILVGLPEPDELGAAAAAPPTGDPKPGSTAGSAGNGLVNINTADQPELETLPGVGPVTAQAIIDWRTEHNGFGAVEELLDVQGIGEVTLAELAPHVTV
ncbi:MAG: helix-hairpin-helix domain-containing protein [Nocardioides sp.]